MKKKILIFTILLGAVKLQAQQNPELQKPAPVATPQSAIPVEFMTGSDRYYFQAIISKDIPETNGKLRFISVTNYATEYKNENAREK